MQLWKYIKEAMLQNPRQKVCEQQAEMNYEEIVMFAEMFARKIKHETCCAILCGSEMAASMALLSCFAAGVTAVPLSVRYGELHCNKILDMISPTAVISDMDGELQVIHMTNSHYIKPQEHPALIMCTSGTTGIPKGVMLSEQNILSNVKDICSYFAINHEDAILIARPLYHCAVLTGEFLTALIKGVRIHFYSEEFQPHKLLKLINENEITVFCGTPTLLSMMARFKRQNTECTLKTLCISGECMSKETGIEILNSFPSADIYHVYGLTEACPRVSYLPPDLFKKHPDSVGVALDSVSLKIIKSNGCVAEIGEEGILWIRGGNVMFGYYENMAQTKTVLKDGWLCTGDIAVIDGDGLLRVKGRSDDLIIRAGMNIYPQEVEKALKIDARVREVLVYGINHPCGGVIIGMKISGDFSTIDEVKELCIQVLPSFQIPSHIELLDELPKNGSGKIIRNNKNIFISDNRCPE